MKIEQKPKFQPITITLETVEEANLFWEVVTGGGLSSKAQKLELKLSNWFSKKAQLGDDK